MSLVELIGKIRLGEEPDAEDADVPRETEPEPEAVEPDPRPNRSAKGGAGKPPPPKVTAAVRKDVTEKLSMLLDVPAFFWAQRDPYCAGVFNQQQEDILVRLTTVACKNRRALAWLTTTGEYTDWIMLATACWPVVAAVWSHHVSRSMDMEPDYGNAADHAPGGDPWAGQVNGAAAWAGYPA